MQPRLPTIGTAFVSYLDQLQAVQGESTTNHHQARAKDDENLNHHAVESIAEPSNSQTPSLPLSQLPVDRHSSPCSLLALPLLSRPLFLLGKFCESSPKTAMTDEKDSTRKMRGSFPSTTTKVAGTGLCRLVGHSSSREEHLCSYHLSDV